MTDNEIKHFLTLQKKVGSATFLHVLWALVFFANAYFQFFEIFGVLASLFIGAMFSYNCFLSFLKSSDDAKSYALIQKLISQDAKLVQQLSQSPDV